MKLGRYEVVRELGKGAMGVVYLAKDPLIGRLVALKTIRLSGEEDEEASEFQQRFVREAQAAGILNHPSIVTVHDIGQDPETGTSFIAMEYVEGLNLKEVLMQEKKLTHHELGEIIAQIADALDVAHSKGITHRDIKPANIILCDKNTAKITDFGIAKIASGAANLTTTGQFLGTPNYMAPEQIKGGHVDGRTDLFSLGIVFYECLARKKPFAGDSLTTISYRIVHERFAPLKEIDPTIPAGFEEVIARCLEKDPVRRYQRGRDMAADIRATIQGKPIPKRSDVALEETMQAQGAPRRTPTQEVPFPEADLDGATIAGGQAASLGSQTGKHTATQVAPAHDPTVRASAAPAPGSMSGSSPRVRPMPSAAPPAPSLGEKLRGIFKLRLPAPVFFGIVAAALAPAVVAGLMIRQAEVDIPTVDTKREVLVAQQRTLRLAGSKALRDGNADAAYTNFRQLLALAPTSPTARRVVERLESIRNEQLSAQQKLAEADAKFEEGKLKYMERDFQNAILLFEEAFHLNPNLDEVVAYLRMSREQLALDQSRGGAPPALGGGPASTQPRGGQAKPRQTSGAAVAAAPASLNVTLASVFKDGYVLVKINGETVVQENLFEETGRFIKRKTPRLVNVTKDVASNAVAIEVWVVVPSEKIQERRQLTRNFAPGSQQKLIVTIDQESKKVDIQL